MKTGIILQARTGSTRLPKKMILPFYADQSILDLLIQRISRQIHKKLVFILATSKNPQDDPIEDTANHYNVKIYRGSEDNVLLRYIEAAEKFKIDRIIRVCGDNPLFDIAGTIDFLEKDPHGNFDYVSYRVNNKPSILSHLGFWGELVKLDALKKILHQTDDKQYLEHVTNFIYHHPSQFKLKLWDACDGLGSREDIRLTVDTKVDFELNRKIYRQLIEQRIPLVPAQIVNFIDRHPEMKATMQTQIAINNK